MAAFTRDLNIVARCTQMYRTQRLKPIGLCGGQAAYLFRLCREPGLTQEELARALYVNKSTAARQIGSLERAGFVERRPSENDRRCLEIYPTQKALDAMPLIRQTVDEWSDLLLEGLTDGERAALQSAMARVSARAQAYIRQEVGWNE